MPQTFAAGQTLKASQLNALPRGPIAYGRRTSNSTNTTGEHGVLRLDGVAVEAGRAYHIRTSAVAGDASAIDVVVIRIRYSDSGTATTGSAILPGGFAEFRQADASVSESLNLNCLFNPSSNATLSLLLTVHAAVNGSSSQLFADGNIETRLEVIDIGMSVTASGVNI